ncbi:MAG: hypothetical protein JSS20_15470, partial [Proteobacteria bacterium]|nr:hypothetical protein [Pseudomonadota bacterium]
MDHDRAAPPRPPSRSARWLAALEPILLIAIGVLEGVLLFELLITGRPTALKLIGVHAGVLVVLSALLALAMAQKRDCTATALALIAAGAVGPLAPFGIGAIDLMGRLRRQPTALVDEWYQRIAASTTVPDDQQLCDDVGAGRTLDLGGELPASFPEIMLSGTLGERQLVLGHIARHFHPSYLGTLSLAL